METESDYLVEFTETLGKVYVLRNGAAYAIELLEDALHALRNDASSVTDEYVDRALDVLRLAMEKGSVA